MPRKLSRHCPKHCTAPGREGGREKGKQAGMGGTKWEMDRVSMEELAFMEEEGKRKGEVSKGGRE